MFKLTKSAVNFIFNQGTTGVFRLYQYFHLRIAKRFVVSMGKEKFTDVGFVDSEILWNI